MIFINLKYYFCSSLWGLDLLPTFLLLSNQHFLTAQWEPKCCHILALKSNLLISNTVSHMNEQLLITAVTGVRGNATGLACTVSRNNSCFQRTLIYIKLYFELLHLKGFLFWSLAKQTDWLLVQYLGFKCGFMSSKICYVVFFLMRVQPRMLKYKSL